MVEDTRQSAFGPELGHVCAEVRLSDLGGCSYVVLKIWKVLKLG